MTAWKGGAWNSQRGGQGPWRGGPWLSQRGGGGGGGGAAPMVTGRLATNGGFGATQQITFPAHSTGDLLICYASIAAESTDLSVNESLSGAGWTRSFMSAADGVIPSVAVFAKIADEDDDLNVKTTGGAQAWWSYGSFAISGVASVGDIYIDDARGSTGTSHNPPAVSPGVGSFDWLALATDSALSTVTITDPPTGYNEFTTSSPANQTNKVSSSSAESTIVSSESEDPGAFTSSASNSWRALTIMMHG